VTDVIVLAAKTPVGAMKARRKERTMVKNNETFLKLETIEYFFII
jgi:hypothetical protein